MSMDLGLLQSQFLTCFPLKDIKWTQDVATESTQQDIVAATLRNEVISKKPISKSYLSAFMKLYMSKIEEFGGEIYDVTFEAYGDVLTLPESEISYKHYTLRDKLISLQETSNLIAEGTTGLKTWQASQYLAEYLLHNPDVLKDRDVLELGCGLGFLGLSVCSECKCSSYTLTDHHESVLRKVRLNLAENEMSLLCAPSVLEIDWETVNSEGLSVNQRKCAESSQIILAADVVFDSKLFPSLVSTLKVLLSHMPEGSCAYIASTLRNEQTYTTFKNTLDQESLSHEVVESSAPKIFLYDSLCKVEIIQINKEQSLGT